MIVLVVVSQMISKNCKTNVGVQVCENPWMNITQGILECLNIFSNNSFCFFSIPIEIYVQVGSTKNLNCKEYIQQ